MAKVSKKTKINQINRLSVNSASNEMLNSSWRYTWSIKVATGSSNNPIWNDAIISYEIDERIPKILRENAHVHVFGTSSNYIGQVYTTDIEFVFGASGKFLIQCLIDTGDTECVYTDDTLLYEYVVGDVEIVIPTPPTLSITAKSTDSCPDNLTDIFKSDYNVGEFGDIYTITANYGTPSTSKLYTQLDLTDSINKPEFEVGQIETDIDNPLGEGIIFKNSVNIRFNAKQYLGNKPTFKYKTIQVSGGKKITESSSNTYSVSALYQRPSAITRAYLSKLDLNTNKFTQMPSMLLASELDTAIIKFDKSTILQYYTDDYNVNFWVRFIYVPTSSDNVIITKFKHTNIWKISNGTHTPIGTTPIKANEVHKSEWYAKMNLSSIYDIISTNTKATFNIEVFTEVYKSSYTNKPDFTNETSSDWFDGTKKLVSKIDLTYSPRGLANVGNGEYMYGYQYTNMPSCTPTTDSKIIPCDIANNSSLYSRITNQQKYINATILTNGLANDFCYYGYRYDLLYTSAEFKVSTVSLTCPAGPFPLPGDNYFDGNTNVYVSGVGEPTLCLPCNISTINAISVDTPDIETYNIYGTIKRIY